MSRTGVIRNQEIHEAENSSNLSQAGFAGHHNWLIAHLVADFQRDI